MPNERRFSLATLAMINELVDLIGEKRVERVLQDFYERVCDYPNPKIRNKIADQLTVVSYDEIDGG